MAVANLSSRLELFADHHLIDRLDGAELRLHRPEPANVAMTFDQPWEGPFSGYATVIHDGAGYHLYYRGQPTKRASRDVCTCYAHSKDGIAFARPNLGLYEVYGGTRQNNAILALTGPGDQMVVHNFSPMLDTRPGVPEAQRFKALGGAHGTGGLRALVSADGVHWSRLRDEAVFQIERFGFDSQNVSFWSEHEGCYLMYFRTFKPAPTQAPGTHPHGWRWISRTTSDDYVHWSDPVEMPIVGPPDEPEIAPEHYYTNQTHPYFRASHLYVALPMRFTPQRQIISDTDAERQGLIVPYNRDISDGLFMTSRGGGERYDRTFPESFMRPGLDPLNWASRTNMSALNVVPTPDGRMSLYYQHRYASSTHHLMRYTLRTDGFASLHAGWRGGEMVTRPFTFAGSELVINFATGGAGGVRIEMQDEEGKPLPGLSLDDTTEQYGDDQERVVNWGNRQDVAAHAGRKVRLRFALRDADVYSMRFR